MSVKQLLEKYFNNDISPSELSILKDLIRSDSSQAELDRMIEAMLKEKTSGKVPGFDKEQMFNAIINEPVVSIKSVRKAGTWYKYAAAAIVIIISGAAYFLIGSSQQKQSTAIVALHNGTISPGSNRATLTLANGQVIFLDSVRQGTIAEQNGTRAIKTDAGILTYDGTEVKDNSEIVYNTIETPRGGQYHIILPDGSKVWLNSSSSLHFPTRFAGDHRQVKITGEAYFEIARDAEHPFRVMANDVTTEVLGTSFNINAYDDEPLIKTTLVEGKVRVSNPYFNAVINPGQQAALKNRTHAVNIVNTAHEVAWKNGFFEFENTSIESIMRQLSRWYDLDVVYEGKTDKLFLATIPRNASISQVLRVLEYTDAVHFAVNGNTVTIKP